ncbi:MAG: Asp-tRNA(Asn)/Glu-tRNA(Gln) amidotransferase subunit GatC [Gammaproteobacteria bacterium]|nr:Asp-tRNA(Asn)/Glu-tRNA(Gln) amidotransferase subunit GatC [Gammaproteobacteria bacterium]
MAVDRSQVKKIAQLARLEISESEIDDYARDMSRILELVEQMDAAETQTVAPMAHPQDGRLRLRQDIADEPNRREEFQRIAPATEAGFYLVPRVVE